MARTRPLLAATLIVRDEAANLPRCLAALTGVVDEIVVYDTGSRDDTVTLGRRAGARVLEGSWDGDFARARNAALDMTRATWALVVDADEVLQADGATLRAFLGGRVGRPAARDLDVLLTQVVNVGPDGDEQGALDSVRIFRTSSVHYTGRVHEHPVLRDGGVPRGVELPRSLVHVRHAGYATVERARAKAERNLAIAQRHLDELAAGGGEDLAATAQVLLNLGRSLVGVGQRQRALDAFETLRELTEGVVPVAAVGGTGVRAEVLTARAQGTALLAQLLLDEGGFDEVVLVLEADLRACRADRRWCDWLRAQALARLGGREEALGLLRGVDALVDPMGNHHGLGPVLQARTLHALAAGHVEEAGEALAEAMAAHGAGAGHAGLLLELWSGREDALATRLAELGGRSADATPTGGPAAPARLSALATELRTAGDAGARVADRLTSPSPPRDHAVVHAPVPA